MDLKEELAYIEELEETCELSSDLNLKKNNDHGRTHGDI
jgi:hypothetical protein